MADRPILFSSAMVRALLDGRKTQTRRVVQGAPTGGGWFCDRVAGGGLRFVAPSMFMPRWASRLTLVVTEVRVERLQNISEADAIAEAAPAPPEGFHGTGYYDDYRESFSDVWDSLNAKRGFNWETNPWIVAVTFTVHHQNIDALGAQEAA